MLPLHDAPKRKPLKTLQRMDKNPARHNWHALLTCWPGHTYPTPDTLSQQPYHMMMAGCLEMRGSLAPVIRDNPQATDSCCMAWSACQVANTATTTHLAAATSCSARMPLMHAGHVPQPLQGRIYHSVGVDRSTPAAAVKPCDHASFRTRSQQAPPPLLRHGSRHTCP
jgi:hypothetical protein